MHVDYDAATLWPALESLDLPVLLVYGSRGMLDIAEVEEFTRRAPQARAIRLESGHNVQRDAPRELASAIQQFVQ
jgi:pimeloyl-ACP methyl ester carboxylesterase